MNTVPASESLPPRLIAGDALTVSIQTGQPSTSTFKLVLTAVINNAPVRILLGSSSPIAIDDTGVALLQLPSSTTSAWQPARYDWVAMAVDGTGDRTTIGSGVTVIDPDPAGTNPTDPRTYNLRMLDQIRALRAGKALDDVQMYKIGTRELTHYTHAELAKLEAEFEQRVRGERIRNGQRVPTRNKGISFGGRR